MKLLTSQDFEKLNLRIGTIKAIKPHPKIPEYILLIDLGPAERDMQIIADLKESYTMSQLLGKQVLFLENFKPTVIAGLETQGLLLVAYKKGKPILLQPEKKVLPGVKIYGLRDTELTYHLQKK